jgi:hypothetical protein
MAKKGAKSAAASALFGGKATKKKSASKSSGKQRESVSVPPELVDDMEIAAAYRQIKDDLKKKGDSADKRVKAHCQRWWCERFAATGKRPDMTHFVGGEGSFDFVVTKRISVTAEKQEALEMIGADISEYVETSGIAIDMDAVVRLGYMDKLQEAISELVDDPEHVAEIFTPKVTVKDGIIEALPGIAEECEADGGLADKIEAIVEILKPVPQVKKAELEGADAEACFARVNEATLAGGKKK